MKLLRQVGFFAPLFAWNIRRDYSQTADENSRSRGVLPA